MSIRIYSPEGAVGAARVTLAGSPDVLAGLRIAALDNGKPGAAAILTRVAEKLAERTGVSFVGIERKATAATPCADELLEQIAGSADLVLTGTAD